MMPWLTVLGVLPVVVGLVLLVLPSRVGRLIGLVTALVLLVLGCWLVVWAPDTALRESVSWIPAIGARYALGLDGMGEVLVGLTVVLVPLVMVAEWSLGDPVAAVGEDGVEERPRPTSAAFFGHVLVLEGLALMCFLATDVLLFYLFFEATLVPMYFLIGGWGGLRRGSAAVRFLLFNLAGGLVMLFGVIGVAGIASSQGAASLELADLRAVDFSGGWGQVLFLAFFVAFAIKAPMFPVHSWLPEAASQARPGASVLMVGVLDKIGAFGMIRFCLGLFPEASRWAAPVILVLAVVSILYGALVAIAQDDLLRLVAFTSVSHFGFMIFGIFAFTTASLNGAILYMLAHGLGSAAFFLVVGFMAARRGSVLISDFGGMRKVAPLLGGFFLIAGLTTLSLPGFASFPAEYLVLAGAWQRHPVMTAVALLGTVLAAVYVMLAYQRTMTGEPTAAVTEHVTSDLTGREKLVLGPLVALLLLIGFAPTPVLHVIEPTSNAAMSDVGLSDPAPIAKEGK